MSRRPDRWLYWLGTLRRWTISKSVRTPGPWHSPAYIRLHFCWICTNMGTWLDTHDETEWFQDTLLRTAQEPAQYSCHTDHASLHCAEVADVYSSYFWIIFTCWHISFILELFPRLMDKNNFFCPLFYHRPASFGAATCLHRCCYRGFCQSSLDQVSYKQNWTIKPSYF